MTKTIIYYCQAWEIGVTAPHSSNIYPKRKKAKKPAEEYK